MKMLLTLAIVGATAIANSVDVDEVVDDEEYDRCPDPDRVHAHRFARSSTAEERFWSYSAEKSR